MIVFMFLFCINYYLCVYINITRDCIVLQQYDVMIYCQEYGIVTDCKQIVEVVRLSNHAITKQINIFRYRMRPLNTKLYIFSHYMIYCKTHVTVVCSIQMKNRKSVELSDIYLYICYFFLSHEASDHNITLYLFMSCRFLLQL
jgi:hypothetical protein